MTGFPLSRLTSLRESEIEWQSRGSKGTYTMRRLLFANVRRCNVSDENHLHNGTSGVICRQVVPYKPAGIFSTYLTGRSRRPRNFKISFIPAANHPGHSFLSRYGEVLPYCLGGPGYLLNRKALSLMGPHVPECKRDWASEHSDTEIGRCVARHVGVSCEAEPYTQWDLKKLFV